MNAATPLGAWGRSIISFAALTKEALEFAVDDDLAEFLAHASANVAVVSRGSTTAGQPMPATTPLATAIGADVTTQYAHAEHQVGQGQCEPSTGRGTDQARPTAAPIATAAPMATVATAGQMHKVPSTPLNGHPPNSAVASTGGQQAPSICIARQDADLQQRPGRLTAASPPNAGIDRRGNEQQQSSPNMRRKHGHVNGPSLPSLPPAFRKDTVCSHAGCGSKFGLFSNKLHNCRNCGAAVCHSHARNTIALPFFGMLWPFLPLRSLPVTRGTTRDACSYV